MHVDIIVNNYFELALIFILLFLDLFQSMEMIFNSFVLVNNNNSRISPVIQSA